MASDSTQLCRRKGLINTLINSIRDTCIQIDELDLLALFTQFAPKSTRSIGSIQQPELVAALESLGVAVTQDQLDMLFGLFDAVDGGCDYAAFCTAIQDRSQEANDDHHEQLQETESKEACSEPKYEQREFSETAELMYRQKQQEIVEVCFCIWCIAVQEILAPVGAVPPMPSLDLVQQADRYKQSPYRCTHKMRRKPRNVLEKLRLVAPSPIRQPMPVPPCSNPNEGNRHLRTVARHRQWNRIKLQEEASLVKEQALKRYAARISDAKVMVRDQALRIREGALATARRVARTEQQLELKGFQKQEENRRQTEASFNSERHRRNGIKRARREATQYRQRMRLQFQSMADQRPELAKPKKRLLAALPELPIVCFEPDAVFKRLLRYDKTKHFLAPMTWRT